MTHCTALIAEDEPLLARALQAELAKQWPALQIVATVGDGKSAVEQCLSLRPDIAFLDIRMPGQTGLDAAAELVDQWPDDAPGFPKIVFVTAYDQYALQAFDTQAVDYVLKPVQPARLAKTVHKLQQLLQAPAPDTAHTHNTQLQSTIQQLHQLLASTALAALDSSPQISAAVPRIKVIQATVGNAIHMVPVADVQYFEAADKYVRVLTADREYLIRTPLKELMPQLDPQEFMQIHRGTIVQVQAIDRVVRDEAGKPSIHLKKRPERLAVSRLYAEHFKAM